MYDFSGVLIKSQINYEIPEAHFLILIDVMEPKVKIITHARGKVCQRMKQ